MKHAKQVLAKLTPPRLSKILERPRLYHELDQGRQKPIVWVEGQAGMGKTTLAASYVRARQLSVLWYQIDEGDTDPATLFHFLGLACPQYGRRKTALLPHFTPEFLLGLQTFTRRFFEQLYARFKSPSLLIFDNYHLLPEHHSIHEVIKTGLEVIPTGLTVMILSRLSPPSSLVRLIANQMVHGISNDALRLTQDETADLIALRKGKQFGSPALISHLYQTAKGWTAGTILTLEQKESTGVAPPSEPIQHELIFQYVAQEVMAMLPEATQALLLSVAFAPSFTVSMAQWLSRDHKAEAILRNLYKRQFFLERKIGSPITYQLHPLFQAFLQQEAQDRLGLDRIAQIKKETAVQLAEEHQLEEALPLLLENRQFTEAIQLILPQAPKLLEQGRWQQLEEWMALFPQDMLRQYPWMGFWLGQCKRTHNLEEAQEWFIQVYCDFETQQDVEGQLSAWCALVETIHLAWKDWEKLQTWLAVLPEITKTLETFPATELHAQAVFNLFSLISMYPYAPEDTLHWETLAFQMLTKHPMLLGQLPTGHLLPLVYINSGHIQRASEVFRYMDGMSTNKTPTVAAQLSCWYVKAHLLWLTGQVQEATQVITQAIAYGRETGCVIYELPFTFLRCWVAWSDYDFLTMTNILNGPIKHFAPEHSAFGDHYRLLSGAKALLQEDWDAAQRYLSNFNPNQTPLVQAKGFHQAFWAHMAYQKGDRLLANTHLLRTQNLAKKFNNTHLMLLTTGTRALWALAQDDESSARKYLEEGLPVARAQNLQFFHYWPKPKFSLLCAKALEWEIEVEFVRNLIRKFRLRPEEPPLSNPHWPWAVRICTLGRFSVEVDGVPLSFGKKSPRKVLNFLKVLIACGGKEVPETKLSDTLWSDADGDLAHQTFATTLHRLRKLLGREETLVLHDSKLSLKPDVCWMDTWALDYIAKQSPAQEEDRILKHLTTLVSLYQGPFLPDCEDEAWSFRTRERLRSLFIRTIYQWISKITSSSGKEHTELLLSLVMDREPDSDLLRQQFNTIQSRLHNVKGMFPLIRPLKDPA
ncbi:MAG: hypothetical protein R3B83_08450 [Nitrospirales bacterium]|nr:hypothetical protein [Nitrospirales bacterium]